MRKSRGKSIQAAPHDIENPNPYMQLRARMMEEFKLDIPPPMSPKRCIFRVPNRLRCEHDKAIHYTPQVVSIGPLHYGNPALKDMEEHKKRYLQYFMGRTNNLSLLAKKKNNNNLSLMHYIKKIKDQEATLRSYYSETINFESDEFVRIILVDAIFIIEFLFRNWYPELLDDNDCIFGKPGMVEDVWPDLLMLENQLPYFILVDLFDPDIFSIPFDRLKGVKRLSILFLSHYFLNGVPTFGGRSDDLKTICSSEVKHFVDLLRKLCIAPMLKEQYQGQFNHTTESPADVGQQSGHMIDDELVRVNVHDEVGAHMSLGAAAPLGTARGTAAPLGTNEFSDSDWNVGTTESLGTNELESLGNVGTTESLSADELEGDISEDFLVGAAAPLGLSFPLFDSKKKKRSLLGCPLFYRKKKAQSAEQSKYTTTPSIEELHLAGVEFKDQSTKNLFDIRFEHGILKIPKLMTEDRTELILRNLVAFEQCAFITQKINKNESVFEECYISDYVGIMDQFVDTAKDVELLVKYKIVENILGGGNDALSTMINSVSTGVICLRKNTSLAYVTICEDLKEFCGSNWNKSKASLRQNYFNTPWATISFCAAVFLLILTVVQTICSIISLS